jgi:hypothetical protein
MGAQNDRPRTGDLVRLTKLATPLGGLIACPPGLYQPGLWDGILALPIGHVLEGYLMADLVCGHPLQLRVLARNAVAVRERYTSERLLRLEGDHIWTWDAVYLIRFIAKVEVAIEPGRL